MPFGNCFHVIGFHLYQPPGNLQALIGANEQEARQIIHCYDRITRFAHKFPDTVWFHVSFSGLLLEQLRDPRVIDRYRAHLDIPAMLESYRLARNIEFIATGYAHPVFPLIPKKDWEDQLVYEKQLIEDTFGRPPLGFYPPEMAFHMELIPLLAKAGYQYTIINANHIFPENESADAFMPYRASYGDSTICIVSRDGDISNAQQNGLEVVWFANEMGVRTRHSMRPHESRLITTFSEAESTDFFRSVNDNDTFFGKFLTPYMSHVRSGRYPIRPVPLAGYLRDHPPEIHACVRDTPFSNEDELSDKQKQALTRIRDISHFYDTLLQRKGQLTPELQDKLVVARRLILESQASCFLLWGDDWLNKLYERVQMAEKMLTDINIFLKPVVKEEPKPVVAKVEAKSEAAVKTTPVATNKVGTKPEPSVKTASTPPQTVAKPELAAVKPAESKPEPSAKTVSTPPQAIAKPEPAAVKPAEPKPEPSAKTASTPPQATAKPEPAVVKPTESKPTETKSAAEKPSTKGEEKLATAVSEALKGAATAPASKESLSVTSEAKGVDKAPSATTKSATPKVEEGKNKDHHHHHKSHSHGKHGGKK